LGVLGKKMDTVRNGSICHSTIQIGPLVSIAEMYVEDVLHFSE